MNTIQGDLTGKGIKIAMVASRFNEFIVSKLVDGAKDALLRHGVDKNDIDLTLVPGAFEIPLACQWLIEQNKYDAILALGCVIRGATSHYDYVCQEVSKGIAKISLDKGVPIMFGILTTENIEQAIERAGTKSGNKGFDVAMGALEMINLRKGFLK